MANSRDPGRMRPPKVKHTRLKAVMLPEVLEASMCSARLIGDCCVLVENHLGLCTLGEKCIAVQTKCGTLQICGESLLLSEVRRDALLVRGKIEKMGYNHV